MRILVLGRHDLDFAGHAASIFHALPEEKYDKRLVLYERCRTHGATLRDARVSVFFGRSLAARLLKAALWRLAALRARLAAGEPVVADSANPQYGFFRYPHTVVSARAILRRAGFMPDVILLHDVKGFVDAKTIRRLHDLTGAHMLFVFVDEEHLGGGCIYPNDCTGWQRDCDACPALVRGRRLARKVLAERKRWLADMPKLVNGTPYDCRMAQRSPVMANAVMLPHVSAPAVRVTPPDAARRGFGIGGSEFVVLFGAANVADKRKGLVYAVAALRQFASRHEGVCLLLPGRCPDGLRAELCAMSGLRVVAPGMLGRDDLFRAFAAADCFVSPSLADSGPMMVNFSVAIGTPVVAFGVGVAEDIVLHKQTGYIAAYKDSADLACGLDYIYALPAAEREAMRSRCRELMAGIARQPSLWDRLYDYVVEHPVKR